MASYEMFLQHPYGCCCGEARPGRIVSLKVLAVAPDKNSDIKDALAARLRELRELRGLSQDSCARACGLSKVFLGCLERGEKAATVETLEKLARGLNVEPMELLRFGGVPDAESSATMKLAQKVAALAHGASPSKLAHFAEIARHYFAADEAAATGTARRSRGRGRQS